VTNPDLSAGNMLARAMPQPMVGVRERRSRTVAAYWLARSRWLDPLLFGLLAALVSATGSWIPSKWNDEAATQTAASRSLAELWQMVQKIDAVHGFYYAFMHFWIIPFGTSNFAMRAPSVIAVAVACAGVVVLGKRLGTRRIALYSAAIFMILPRVTWMGMEARSYALTALVAVWLTVILVGLVDGTHRRWWAAYAILAALGAILNVYLALLVLAHGVSLVLARRRRPQPPRVLVSWAISAAVAALCAAPVVLLVVGQTGQLPFGPLTFGNVANSVLFQQYFTGAAPTVQRSVPFPPTSGWATAAIVLACCGWTLMIALVASRRLRSTIDRTKTVGLLAMAVPWIVVPFVLLMGFSLAVTPIYTARYFSFTTPAVALLMGACVAAFAKRWKRIGAIALIAVVALPVYLSQRGPTSKNATDWEQAAAVLQAHASPGQNVYYGPIAVGSSLSTSKVRDAYPAVLSRLNDITLDQTGVESNTLWDSQRPLTDARSTLRATAALWVVLAHPGIASPASTVQQRYLEKEGLHLSRAWRGESTDVLLYTR
jgi:mannosyltransferase